MLQLAPKSSFAWACPGGCFVLGSGSRVFNNRLMENRFNKNLSLPLCSDATAGRFISCDTETTMAPVTQKAKKGNFIREEVVPRVPEKQG